MQERKFRHVGWSADAVPSRDQLRTAHREELLRAQLRDVQPRPVALAVADRDVDILAREVDVMQGRRHPEIDGRMRLGKPPKPMNEPLGGEVGRRADRQDTGGLALHQALGPDPDAVERVAHLDQIVAAGFRYDYALAFAVEQFDAKLVLVAFDLR